MLHALTMGSNRKYQSPSSLKINAVKLRAVTAVCGRLSGGECYSLVFVCHSIYKMAMRFYETFNHLL